MTQPDTLLPLLAEVLDKEPTLLALIAPLVCVGIAGFLLALWRWPLVIVPVGIAIPLVVAGLSELFDRYVGPAIWRESPTYYLCAIAAGCLAVVGPVCGAVVAWRRSGRYGPV